MNAATAPNLEPISADIFSNVCAAMQAAEEIWGPSEDDYPDLMDAIIAECEQRKTNYYLESARAQTLTVVPPPNRSR